MMLSTMIKVSLILFSIDAYSSQLIPKIDYCNTEINKFLKQKKNQGEWRFLPAINHQDQVYRAPTRTIGNWIELKKTDQNVVLKELNSSGELTTHIYEKNKCQNPTTSKGTQATQFDSAGFDDDELKALVEKPELTLIYVWNPAAALSLTHFTHYETEARKRNIKLISLLSQNADKSWAQKVAKKFNLGTQIQSSYELYFRGAEQHYPSAFIVGKSKVSSRLMGGLESQNVGRFFNNTLEGPHDSY